MKISQPCPIQTSTSADNGQTEMACQDYEAAVSFIEAKRPGDVLRPPQARCDTGVAANRKPLQNDTYLQLASSAQQMARDARKVHRSIASFQESIFYSSLPLVSFLYIVGAAAVIPRVCKGQPFLTVPYDPKKTLMIGFTGSIICGLALLVLGIMLSLAALWFVTVSFARYVDAFCNIDLVEYSQGDRKRGLVAQDPDGRTVTLTAKELVLGS
ncbi:hypothetical protein H1R20_g12401, partial [Candolleomyces eurysporus]